MRWKSVAQILVILIIIAIMLFLFLRPTVLTDSKLEYTGRSMEGESAYTVAKKEIQDWATLILPIVSLYFAVRRKGEKNGKKV